MLYPKSLFRTESLALIVMNALVVCSQGVAKVMADTAHSFPTKFNWNSPPPTNFPLVFPHPHIYHDASDTQACVLVIHNPASPPQESQKISRREAITPKCARYYEATDSHPRGKRISEVDFGFDIHESTGTRWRRLRKESGIDEASRRPGKHRSGGRPTKLLQL